MNKRKKNRMLRRVVKALELLNEIETDLLNGLMDYLTGGNIGSAEWQLSRMQLLGRLQLWRQSSDLCGKEELSINVPQG